MVAGDPRTRGQPAGLPVARPIRTTYPCVHPPPPGGLTRGLSGHGHGIAVKPPQASQVSFSFINSDHSRISHAPSRRLISDDDSILLRTEHRFLASMGVRGSTLPARSARRSSTPFVKRFESPLTSSPHLVHLPKDDCLTSFERQPEDVSVGVRQPRYPGGHLRVPEFGSPLRTQSHVMHATG